MPINLGSAVFEFIGDATNFNNTVTGVDNQIASFSKNMSTALMGAGAAGIAALGAFGLKASTVAADFETQVNIMGVAARNSGTSMEDLSEAALQIGADTELVGISASEAADAMTNFYKAGMTTNDMFGDLNSYLTKGTSLTGAMRAAIDLAAGSELDLATASETVAVAMATFGLSADDATRISDSFVASADASLASVSDLTLAMQNIGPTAATFGWSLEETNTALALLSSRGIAGAEAGTALKSMMTNLMRPTDDVVDELNNLGVSLYTAEGTMRSLPDIMGQLSSALELGSTRTVTHSAATKDMAAAAEKAAEQMTSLERALVVAEAHTGMNADQMRALEAEYAAANGTMEGFGRTLGGNTYELYKAQTAYDDAKAAIAAYSDATNTSVESTTIMTEEQRNASVQLLSGTYGMKAMNTLLDEGADGWNAMADAIANGATASETAAARTQGFNAAMEQLKGNIEAFMIRVGTPLIQMFMTPLIKKATDLMGIITDMIPSTEEVAAIFQNLQERILPPLTAAFQFVSEHADAFIGALKGIGIVLLGFAVAGTIMKLTALLNPITAIIAAAAALGAAWNSNLGGIKDKTQEVIGFIIDKIKKLKEAFDFGGLPAVWEKIKEWWDAAWKYLVDNVPVWIKNIGTKAGELWRGLVDWWDTGGKQLTIDALTSIGKWVSDVVVGIGKSVSTWATDLGIAVGKWWRGWVDWWDTGGAKLVTDALTKIDKWINSVIDALPGQVEIWITNLSTWVRKLWYTFATWWDTGGAQLTKDVFAAIGRFVAGWFTIEIAGFVLARKWLFEKVGRLYRVFVDWWNTGGKTLVTDTLKEIGKWATDVIRGIGQAVGGWITKLGTEIGKWWRYLVDWWNGGGAQLTTDGIGKVASWVGGVITGIGQNVATWIINLGTEISKWWRGLVTWWDTGGAQLITDGIGKVGTWISGVVTGIGTNLSIWITNLGTEIGKWWRGLVDWWEGGGGALVTDGIGKIGTWIGNIATGIGTNVSTWITTLSTEIGKWWRGLVDWWDTNGDGMVTGAGEKIGAWVGNVALYVQNNAPIWAASIKTAIKPLWDSLMYQDTGTSTQLTGFGSFVLDVQNGMRTLQPVLDMFAGMFEHVGDAVSGLGDDWNKLKPKLVELGKSLQPLLVLLAGLAAAIALALGEVLGSVIDHALGLVGHLADGISGFFNLITDTITGAVDIVVKVFNGDWKGAVESGTKSAEKMRKDMGEIFGAILGIVDEIWGAIFDTISGIWADLTGGEKVKWEDVKTVIGDTWENVKEDASTAWDNIITNLSEVWDEIITNVAADVLEVKNNITGTIESIGTWITDNWEMIVDFGRDLIKGMVDGVVGSVQSLINAVVQAVVDAYNAARDWLLSHSPSVRFMWLGEDTIAGMIIGIENMEPEAAKASADAAKAIIDAAVAAIDLAVRLAETPIADNFAELFAPVMDIMRQLASQFKAFTGSSGLTGDAADNISKAMSTIKSMIEAVSGMTELSVDLSKAEINLEAVGALIPSMADFLQLVASQLTRIKTGDIAKIGPAFEIFNSALVSALNPMAAAMQFAGDLQSIVSYRPALVFDEKYREDLRTIIAGLADLLFVMAEELHRVIYTDEIQQLPPDFVDFVEIVGSVVEPFSDMVDFWSALDEFIRAGSLHGVGRTPILAEFVAALGSTLGLMLDSLLIVMQWPQFEELPAITLEFADTLSAVLGPFSDMLDFWDALDSFIQGGSLHGVGKTDALNKMIASLGSTMGLMLTSIWRLTMWTQFDELPVNVQEFADLLGGVVGPFQEALAFWDQLDSFIQGGSLHGIGRAGLIDDFIAALGSTLGLMLVRIEELMQWKQFKELPVTVTEFADLLGAILEPFSNVLAFWDQLDEFVRGGSLHGMGRTSALQDFIASLGSTLGLMLVRLEEVMQWKQFKELPAEVTEFANVLSAVAGAFTLGLSFLTDLAAWEQADDLVDKFDSFRVTWTAIMDKMSRLRRDTMLFYDEDMVKFATALGSIAGGLQTGIALLADIDTATGLNVSEDKIDTLVQVLKRIMDRLAEGIQMWDTGTSDLVSAFGTAVSALMGGLSAGVSLIATMPAEWAAPSSAVWDPFVDWVEETFATFYDWLNAGMPVDDGTPLSDTMLGGEGIELVSSFGSALSSLVAGLQAAANFTLAEDWQTPNWSVWNNFYVWVMEVFDLVYQWLGVVHTTPFSQTGVYTDEGLALVTAWGSAVGSIFNGLNSALTLAGNLPASWSVDDTVWVDFFGWVTDVFDMAYAWLQTGHMTQYSTTPVYTTEGLALVSAWGGALGSIFGGLQAAVALAGVLPDTWDVDEGVWYSFITWTFEVFSTLYALIFSYYPSSAEDAETFGPVSAWGNALSSVFGGLQAALSMAADFSFTEPDGDTWARFETFTEGVFYRLNQWVVATYPMTVEEAQTAFGPVTAFGNAMSAVFGGLTAGLDLFKGLQGYIGLLNSRIESFLGSVTYTYGLVEEYALGPGVQDGLEATSAFATAVGVVVGAIGQALSVFGQLTDGTSSDLEVFKRRMADVIERMSGTLTAFDEYVVAERDATWIPIATDFSAAVMSVLDVLQRALDLFVALDEHGLPSMAQLQDLIDYTLQLFATFTAGLFGAGTDVEGAGGAIIGAIIGIEDGLPDHDTTATWGAGIGTGITDGLYWAAVTASMMPHYVYMTTDTLLALLTTAFGYSSQTRQTTYGFGVAIGQDLVRGISWGVDPNGGLGLAYLGALNTAIHSLTAYIEAAVRDELGIASPSRLMADLALNIPLGMAQGIEAGIPDVARATAQLADLAAVAGGQFSSGRFEVDSRREVIVRFEGEAGGGVPLDAQQFNDLKRAIIYQIQLGG